MKEFFTYTTPEKVGVSSENVIKFMTELERFGVYLHSFALIKGNEIFAEMYRKPFKKGELHRMYSTTKTFASMALGILIGEGKVKLEDKVIKYFPEYKDCKYSQVQDMTIEDMLRMSTCFTGGTTYKVSDKDWVSTFFNTDTSHPAGTIFNYDTSASYMCNVIVERLTGMPFIEFLKEKALNKIGFSKDSRVLKTPEGYSWGGSALLASTLDLARLARLVMLDGEWDGEQLLPRDYVVKAKSNLIDNAQSGFQTTHGGHGYGYQIWRTVDNTFSFLGMGEQLAICMPEEDLLFVCTADCQGIAGISRSTIYINLWHFIKDTIIKGELSENEVEYKKLKDLCDSSDFPVYPGNITSPIANIIRGKKYNLTANPMGIKYISFDYDDNGNGVMKYENAQGCKELKFGIGKYIIDTFPQDGYFGEYVGTDCGRRYRCITSGAWTNDTTLHIKSDLIDDYFGNLSIIAVFKGDEISLYMEPHAEWFLNEYKGFACGIIEK